MDFCSSLLGSSVFRPPNRSGAIAILSSGGRLRVEDRGGALLAGGVDRRGEVRRDQGRERRERERDPGVADGEQSRDVMASAFGHQLAGERRQGHAHPGSRQHLRHDRPPGRRRGQQGKASHPARDQEATGDRPRLRVARQPRGEQRGDRQDADRQRRGERLDAPSRHQQQDDQEDHRGQRCREQSQRDRLANRKGAGGAIGVPAVVGGHDLAARGLQGDEHPGQHDRRLCEEDRPPRERLGQGPAERGADGDPEDRRRHPHPASRAGPAAIEKLEGRDQPGGPAQAPGRRAGRAAAPASRTPRSRATRRRRAPARRRPRARRRSAGTATRRAASPAPARPCRRRAPARRPRRSRSARPGSTAAPA